MGPMKQGDSTRNRGLSDLNTTDAEIANAAADEPQQTRDSCASGNAFPCACASPPERSNWPQCRANRGYIVARSARRNSGAEANEVYSSRPRRRSSSDRTAGRRGVCVAASGAVRMQWTWVATRNATHQLPRRSSHSCTRSSGTGVPNYENGHSHWGGHNGDDSTGNQKCPNGCEQRSPGRRDCRAISTAGV